MYYHVRIELKSQRASDETKVDMTQEEFEERMLRPYEQGEPIIINGKTVMPDDIDRIRVSRSDVPTSQIIPQLKNDDANSSIVRIGGPSYQWRAADRAPDITDEVIKGPPGFGANKGSAKATGQLKRTTDTERTSTKRIFVVHGHDHALKSDLEVFLRDVGLDPVVLHRKPDEGLTVIEKFERHADVRFAFVLLTPDDLAYPANQAEAAPEVRALEFRARQNVIFEFGYFAGKLGRANVCCIYKEGVTLPSDLSGLLYKPVSNSIEEIGYSLIKELKNAGLEPTV